MRVLFTECLFTLSANSLPCWQKLFTLTKYITDKLTDFFDTLISLTTESRSVSVRKRCINGNTSALFMKALYLTPSISEDSVELLLDSFNSKIKNVIDDIAPVKVNKKTGRQKIILEKNNSSSESKDNAEKLSECGGR